MAFEDAMAAVLQMLTTTEAVAAIGAELHLRSSGGHADPAVEAGLAAVSAAAGVDLDSLDEQQETTLLAVIRLFFSQAGELLAEPDRPPGWTVTDPAVLEGFGRTSMLIPGLLATFPEFANITSFLDVGVGVGWLAVGAARAWPNASIVGVDVWEPALERARANVHDSGMNDRIELRNQDVTTIDDIDAYDGAWLPTFFLPDHVLPGAVSKIVASLRPGGWIVLGRMATPPVPLAQATTTLRTVRSGGAVLDVDQATHLLRAAGCSSIHALDHTSPLPIAFLIGQKPV